LSVCGRALHEAKETIALEGDGNLKIGLPMESKTYQAPHRLKEVLVYAF